MLDTDKSYCLASDSEPDLMDWITKLQLALQSNNEKTPESNYIKLYFVKFKIKKCTITLI